jgi:hypothetical protein
MGAPSPDLCNSWLAQIFNRQGVEAAVAMYYPVASIVAVDTVSAAVLIVTIVANMGIALADFASGKFVLKNSVQVGVSTKWLPMLGALKAAGAAGAASRTPGSSADRHCRGARPCHVLHRRRGHARAGHGILQHRLSMAYLALAIASLVVLL